MAGVVEIRILVLASFMLQVFLLLFAGRRRRNITGVARTLLWLAYMQADSIAIYVLGHMSFTSKFHNNQQFMAFWAPFLLVHLGGQDTITAYSLEDNQLWPRHLLSLVMQALGVAYVLYKYIAGSWTFAMAAALMFVTGVLKYGERIWALNSSNLDNISKFLDNRKLKEAERGEREEYEPYCPCAQWDQEGKLGPEEVLQGAHDLLPICMAQFVDYKFWPSRSMCEAIKLFSEEDRMYELIEMQLSLMHDFLYTKASVIFTWYGCFIRAISLISTITSFFLFQLSIGKSDFNRVDAIVTYILIVGALLLEMTGLLKAVGSTWTCALLRVKQWDRLHNIAVSIRRRIKTSERNRRWSGSIGQPRLLNLSHDSGGWIRQIAKWFGLEYLYDGMPCSGGQVSSRSMGLKDLWKKLHHSLPVISDGTKELVLEEVGRMVKACEGKEDIMRSYNGQCAMNPWHGLFEDPTSRAGIDFDDKILSWYFATKMFLSLSSTVEARQQDDDVVEAIWAVSKYMIFLILECPYMLPSPVRPGLYANTEEAYARLGLSGVKNLIERIKTREMDSEVPPALARGVELATKLLQMEAQGEMQARRVVLGVWVEMLCYAAHHCSRDSHARQLNSGGEFITIVWLLSTAMFNRFYCDTEWFQRGVHEFFRSLVKDEFGWFRWILFCCGIPTTDRQWEILVTD